MYCRTVSWSYIGIMRAQTIRGSFGFQKPVGIFFTFYLYFMVPIRNLTLAGVKKRIFKHLNNVISDETFARANFRSLSGT